MLTLYRRHLKACNHSHKGRKYRDCKCPLWAAGTLRGIPLKRSLDLTSWEAGQRLVRDLEATGELEGFVTRADAVAAFLRDCAARELTTGSTRVYRALLEGTLMRFAEEEKLKFVSQWTLLEVRQFWEGWKWAPITKADRMKKIRAFFTFCRNSGWMKENPARKIKMPEMRVSCCFRGSHDRPGRDGQRPPSASMTMAISG